MRLQRAYSPLISRAVASGGLSCKLLHTVRLSGADILCLFTATALRIFGRLRSHITLGGANRALAHLVRVCEPPPFKIPVAGCETRQCENQSFSQADSKSRSPGRPFRLEYLKFVGRVREQQRLALALSSVLSHFGCCTSV